MSLHVGSIFDVRTRLVPNIRLACRCEIFAKITLCFANSDLDGNAVLVCLAHLLNHSSRLQDLCLAGRATVHPSNRINLEKFRRALSSNLSLESLRLYGAFPGLLPMALCPALRVNRTMTRLEIFRLASYSHASLLVEAVQNNTSLCSVNVWDGTMGLPSPLQERNLRY